MRHLGLVTTDQLMLAYVTHHAPGTNVDTARCQEPHDPSACARGQVLTHARPGLHQPDLRDVSAHRQVCRQLQASSPASHDRGGGA